MSREAFAAVSFDVRNAGFDERQAPACIVERAPRMQARGRERGPPAEQLDAAVGSAELERGNPVLEPCSQGARGRQEPLRFEQGEVFLHNVHISPYSHRGYATHEPMRRRKLLLNKAEIRKLVGKMVERGFTLVPVRMYFKNGRVKVAVAVAKGKKSHDKRETIRRREVDRETRALVKERGR